MREFFKGWRRKLGCVALVMACLLAVGWMRSFSNNDELNIWSGHLTIHSFNSSPMGVSWMKKRNLAENVPMFSGRFGRVAFQTFPNDVCDPFRWSTAGRHTKWGGFHFADATINPPDHGELGIWIAPYWSLVLPLTLLSAYLILWKPRKKKTPPLN